MSIRAVRSILVGAGVTALLIFILWDRFQQAHATGYAGGSMPGAVAISVIAGFVAGAMCWHGLIRGEWLGERWPARLFWACFCGVLMFGVVYLLNLVASVRGGRSSLFGFDPNASFMTEIAVGIVTIVGCLLGFYFQDNPRSKP